MLQIFLTNIAHNLFKPLLLFFYAGFAIPLLKVKFEFPKVLYQGLTIYLLLAIGWHGGEELAALQPSEYGKAAGFMAIGFVTNTIIGIVTYFTLRKLTRLRQIDAATVAGYYGSDSAGTFVTCMGVLTASHIAFAAYMPVMLAVMEIPGCLVALYLVSRMRNSGLDAHGNMPGEPGYVAAQSRHALTHRLSHLESRSDELEDETLEAEGELVGAGVSTAHESIHGGSSRRSFHGSRGLFVEKRPGRHNDHFHGDSAESSEHGRADKEHHKAIVKEDEISLQSTEEVEAEAKHAGKRSAFSKEMLHEVFLNPGIFLLFAGITIGFISRLQGERVTIADDALFVNLFQGFLCLFLLEMGMTASQKLKDLKTAGWKFILFGLLAPNVFATFGMLVAHGFALMTGHPLELGTYVLFAVLCGAASYIALPAVQRMAIPEASPTLPLAASLGLTFSYNVTVGIPVYMMIASLLSGQSPAT